jgi:CRISPR/Cas system endoribonuclease Cas6 (RAMP superfamily)
VYEGDLGPFLPLLRLGELLHVGKHATFGLGRYEVDVLT